VSESKTKSDQQLFLLANCGFTVVDKVPMPHLRYLTERAGCVLHTHLLACLAPDAPVQSLGSYLTQVRPLLLGDETHNRRLFYRLRGLQSMDSSGPRQAVLFSSNSLTASTYRRLIRRCLRVLEVALQRDRSEGDVEEDRLVVVPGAGAGELSWALLWGQVASCLQGTDHLRHLMEEVEQFPSAANLSRETCLTQRLRPLATFLSHRLMRERSGE